MESLREQIIAVTVADLLRFAIWVFIVWLIIRQAVAAALRQQVVQQNDLILRQLAEQTKLLSSIARDVMRGRPGVSDTGDPKASLAARVAVASTTELDSLLGEVNASGDMQIAESYVARKNQLKGREPVDSDDLPPPPAARTSKP